MGGCPTLETDRLILRPFEEADVVGYTAVLQSPEVRRSLHLPDDVGETLAWNQMASWRGQWELRGTGQWALEERATGAFVGRAGLHHPHMPGWPGVEVGWALHPDHWGKGFAAEAGARSVAYAFEELDLDRVVSVILPENDRSMAVARRLGFHLVAERVLPHFPAKAHGIWALERSAWRASA